MEACLTIINVALMFASFGIMAARDVGAGHGLTQQSVILLADLNRDGAVRTLRRI
jgi:hypothetical protein